MNHSHPAPYNSPSVMILVVLFFSGAAVTSSLDIHTIRISFLCYLLPSTTVSLLVVVYNLHPSFVPSYLSCLLSQSFISPSDSYASQTNYKNPGANITAV